MLGGAAIDARGAPLADSTLALARASPMRCCSAPWVGRPGKGWGFDKRPELAILGLRKELGTVRQFAAGGGVRFRWYPRAR